MTDPIDEFLRHLETNVTPIEAARLCGYPPQECARAASAFMQDERAKAIFSRRQTVSAPDQNAYGTDSAMKEAEDAMGFALLTENAGAYIKAVELRAKLKGLLIEKVDVRQAVGFSIRIEGLDSPVPLAPIIPAALPAPSAPSASPPLENDPFAEVDPLAGLD